MQQVIIKHFYMNINITQFFYLMKTNLNDSNLKKRRNKVNIQKKNIYLSLSYRNHQYILHPRIPTLIEFFFAILLNILSSLRRMLTKAGRRSSWDQSGCGRISFMYLWSPRHPMVAGSYGATFRRLCATSASRCGKNCC